MSRALTKFKNSNFGRAAPVHRLQRQKPRTTAGNRGHIAFGRVSHHGIVATAHADNPSPHGKWSSVGLLLATRNRPLDRRGVFTFQHPWCRCGCVTRRAVYGRPTTFSSSRAAVPRRPSTPGRRFPSVITVRLFLCGPRACVRDGESTTTIIIIINEQQLNGFERTAANAERRSPVGPGRVRRPVESCFFFCSTSFIFSYRDKRRCGSYERADDVHSCSVTPCPAIVVTRATRRCSGGLRGPAVGRRTFWWFPSENARRCLCSTACNHVGRTLLLPRRVVCDAAAVTAVVRDRDVWREKRLRQKVQVPGRVRRLQPKIVSRFSGRSAALDRKSVST